MQLENRDVDIGLIAEALGLRGVEVNKNLVAHCPFTKNHSNGDAHPSFALNLKTGLWICYAGCGEGFIVRLVSQLRNIDFPEARNWILSTAGGEIHYSRVLDAMPGAKEVESTNEIAKMAQADYDLMDSETTSAYILDRGFTKRTILDWGFRYDKDMRAIVVPVFDISGRTVLATIRRMIPPISDRFPKYRYTSGFNSSEHLFGAHRCPRDGSPVILVEGALDCIWLHQNGFPNAVALFGAHCSEEQKNLLKRLGNDLILALDGDEAGRAATRKMLTNLSDSFSIKGVNLPDSKDVQELSNKELNDLFASASYAWGLL